MRKASLLLTTMVFGMLLASGMAFAATNSLSNPSQIAVSSYDAATPYPSEIPVSGLDPFVNDVNLTLSGFKPSEMRYVDVLLVGPTGIEATVMSDVSSSGTTSINLTLDDEAAAALPQNGPLSSGTYKPTNFGLDDYFPAPAATPYGGSKLSSFDGSNPNGVWKLYVVGGGYSGTFSGGWSLTITHSTSDTRPPDTLPPDTTLTQKPDALTQDVSPRFSFRSDESPSTFQCKLDGNAFQPCSSPKQYFLLDDGEHTLEVKAVDAAGNEDQSPATHTWTVDTTDPTLTFTEEPEEVTNDRTPTWAWTAEDVHLSSYTECALYDDTNDRRLYVAWGGCGSPFTFGAELPDGKYHYWVGVEDRARNYESLYSYFEVDNITPKVLSYEPTGRRVPLGADVTVTFDEDVVDSKQFVNIYKKGSNTPLPVYRYGYGDEIEISPKSYLKRDTSYTVKVATGVNDGANNLEESVSWSFKTKR